MTNIIRTNVKNVNNSGRYILVDLITIKEKKSYTNKNIKYIVR